MAPGQRLVPTAILILAFLPTVKALDFPQEGQVIVETASTATEGSASLSVSASVKHATLELNRRYVGMLPYAIESLEPGSYLIGVGASGYYDVEYPIILEEKTAYTIYFQLVPKTGYLDLRVLPEDAELRVDGKIVSSRILELPVGTHEIQARRFGFEQEKVLARIREHAATRVEIELEPAPFSISGIVPSRPAFNPENAGPLGRTDIAFTATNYGRARLEIRDAEGTLVAERDFPRIETWKQSFAWTGRGPEGEILPDGTYDIILSASPEAPAQETGSVAEAGVTLTAAARVRIDSSIDYRPPGSLAAMPGSLLFPDPRPIPARGLAAEFAWLASAADASDSAFAAGAALSLGDPGGRGYGSAVLSLGAAAETSGDPEGDVALSLLVPLGGGAKAVAALFARGSWSSAASPVLPLSLPAVELSAPLSLGIGLLNLGLSPGIHLDLSGAEPEVRPLARAAIWLSGPAWRAGASAALALGGDSGFLSPSWPALASAEFRALLAPSPFVAAAYALCELEPGKTPVLAVGLGFGFVM